MDKTYDPTKAAKAQEAYCEQNEVPMFAPANGICSRCGMNIYMPHSFRDHDAVYGISVEVASRSLITSCPHCNATFCD